MVRRLQEIFGFPERPHLVTQRQFDDQQDELKALTQKPWHAIGDHDYSIFLMDICYVSLQQELFDYLFPAVLIRWWEGILNRTGGPDGECDFYRAVDHGAPFYKMMDVARQQHVHLWMVDAYMEGVDAWGGRLSPHYCGPNTPDDLHGPLWAFSALGHSVPILASLIERLMEVKTLGRAQWWLVFASGLAWKENQCPAISPWSPERGGGGVYLLESGSCIYDHGFLPTNLQSLRESITYANVLAMLM